MSRTDAHAPYWTRAVWYEPVHHLYCRFYLVRSWQRRSPEQPCNLPKRPVRHARVRTRVYVPLCTWEPAYPTYRESPWHYFGHVPHWFVNHVWNDVERVRERDVLGEMVKEYNATGDLEDGDFGCWQGRYCARWRWD